MTEQTHTFPHIIVHKEGAEGTIEVDRMDGKVLTSPDARPEWANGLLLAVLHERRKWWSDRLGGNITAVHANPDAVAMQDFAWVAIDPEALSPDHDQDLQTEHVMEIEPDLEHRMEVLAKITGVDLENFEVGTAPFGKIIAQNEVELATQNTYTTEEAAALDAELASSFGAYTESDAKKSHG